MPTIKNTSLAKLWSLIVAGFSPKGHTHIPATPSTPGIMSATDKTKLDSIDPAATKTVVDTALSATSTNPVQNKVTKAALDGKAAVSHAHPDYANQNAFAHVMVGSVDVAADNMSDTLTLVAGANVAITPDAANDKMTISSTNTIYTHPSTHPASMVVEDASHRFATDAEKGSWGAKASTAVVTQSANGLMQASDKTKLDGVSAGANNYTHPGFQARGSGLYKVTVDAGGHVSAVSPVTKGDITALGIPAQDTNTTYGLASQSANGLMPAVDKLKLDGIDASISNAIAAASMGHAVYKGAVTANTDISNAAYKQGWYWVVKTAGTFVGEACDVGDMIFCNSDKGSGYSTAHFDVVQNNLEIREMTSAELAAILV